MSIEPMIRHTECDAPCDTWIENDEHHVVCTVCGDHSVYYHDGRKIVREPLTLAMFAEITAKAC